MRYLAIIGLLVAACGGGDTKFVECEQHSNCSLGPGGLCEQNPVTGNRWCTYPCNADSQDQICSSGRCWSDFDVGDGVSGTCVSAADAGVEPMVDAMDGAVTDAPIADAMDDTDAAVNGPLAELVLGQSGFDTDSANQGGIGKDTLFAPQGIYASLADPALLVVDAGNQRVLWWGDPPGTNKEAAFRVLGQTDSTSATAGTSDSQFNFGASDASHGGAVFSDGNRIIVADNQNNRVMIWSDYTNISSDGAAADLVLGQSSFTSNTSGNGQGQLNDPRGVWTDGTKLVVADTGNNRVLVWNTFPTANGQLPDLVLGQTDFGMSGAASPPSSSSMSKPRGVVSDGTRLFVADAGNNRVLAWTAFPTTNGQGADFVLGQQSATANSANQGGAVGPATLDRPLDVALGSPTADQTDPSALFVADYNNSRVLVYSPVPTATGAAASAVYGQPTLATTPIGDGDPPSQGRLKYPTAISIPQNGTLYVSEPRSNRVVRFALPSN